MEQRKNVFPKKHVKIDLWLVAILVLAAFLYGWNIWKAGSANSFYTSAIISMSESWKNFWYASFDPAGFITVDKPPVALWFMVIFVKIFGLHGWSIVISSVLFSLGSVFLIYKMVKPYFGTLAARIAALLMTLTPIVVADARTNNMDATLVFFLLLACYVLQKAVSKHNIWLVGLAFALVGVSFNVKMLQAFMILPAMYVFYWIASKENWKRILWGSVVGTIALIVFTLS
nr:glycosyltransferase family 39 protein [Liquorilactobacillus hordei]